MGGDVNDVHDRTVILDVAGTAEKSGESFPFQGTVTIADNRLAAPENPALPGGKPICKQRIVSPIAIDITPHAPGSLLLRVDPRGLVSNVEFSLLERVSDAPTLYRFADSSDDQPSANLFNGVRATGAYSFEWLDEASQ